MNTNIDKRLQEILDNYEYGPDWTHDGQSTEEEAEADMNKMIAAIHSAFKDAGYRQNFAAQVFDHEVDKKIKLLDLMTGAEWLERFTKELQQLHEDYFKNGEIGVCKADAWRAARIASGIKEGTE